MLFDLGVLFILTAGRALAFSKTNYGSICPSGNVLVGGNSYKGLLNLWQCVSYPQPLQSAVEPGLNHRISQTKHVTSPRHDRWCTRAKTHVRNAFV